MSPIGHCGSSAPTARLEWDRALDKLERERDLSQDGSPSDSGQLEPPGGPSSRDDAYSCSWEPTVERPIRAATPIAQWS
jgi:hypothetical protein